MLICMAIFIFCIFSICVHVCIVLYILRVGGWSAFPVSHAKQPRLKHLINHDCNKLELERDSAVLSKCNYSVVSSATQTATHSTDLSRKITAHSKIIEANKPNNAISIQNIQNKYTKYTKYTIYKIYNFHFGVYIFLHVKKINMTTIIARRYPLQDPLFAVRFGLDDRVVALGAPRSLSSSNLLQS